MHRLHLLVVVVALNWLAVQALAGSSKLSGPIIMTLSPTHGVHLDDLVTLVAWAIAMAWCVRAWRWTGDR